MLDSGSSELVWFVVGLILLLAEFAIPGLIIIFFGIGAWFTALLIGLGIIESFNLQLIVFLVSSLASLIFLRKKGKKYFEGRVSGKLSAEQSLDDISGEKAVVTSTIIPKKVGGKVEYNGTTWEAESDVTLEPGLTVEIVTRKNLTLVVKPIQ